jgi:hypothetical protein
LQNLASLPFLTVLSEFFVLRRFLQPSKNQLHFTGKQKSRPFRQSDGKSGFNLIIHRAFLSASDESCSKAFKL